MSFSEWKEVRLGDVITFNPRESIAKKQMAKKIAMEKLKPFTKFIDSYELTEFNGGTKFRNGDTLLARITPCLENGKTSQVTILDDNEVGFGSTEYIILREKVGVTNKDYIYYLSISPKFRNIAIKSMVGSSGRQRVQQDMLENTELLLPSLAEQKAIADTLSCLDDKIELNNRMNKTLEEMAQAIFKSWFVDFEPFKDGEFEDSELGSIPKGWSVKTLGELVDIVNGYSYKGSELKESDDAMMTIKNFDRNGGFKIDGFKEIEISERVKDRHYINIFDVLVACTDLTQNAEIIGNPILVLTKSKYNNLIASMDLVKIVPKVSFINNFFLYTLMRNEKFKQFSLGYTSGTTVLHLNKKSILEYKIALPCEEHFLKDFSSIIEPLFKLMSKNINENGTLTIARDSLLPKLMSGDIRIPMEEV